MNQFLLVGVAYVLGLLASAMRLPPLVGYLVAGYALCGLEVKGGEGLDVAADFGIQLLLFTVGLKLELKTLARWDILGAGTLHMLSVVAVAAGTFLLTGGRWDSGLLVGISLAFSSTVLAVKILEDNAELSSLHGRIALGVLIYQDIVAVALLAAAGGGSPTPWALLLLAFPLLRPIASALLAWSSSPELRLMMGLSLALGSSVIAQTMGVAPDLAALWLGALLAGHANAKEMAERLWGIKELFLVAFFLEIGITGVPDATQWLDALSLTALLPLQGMLFFFLFILLRLRARTAFITSLALCTYSEFALITTQVMAKAGWLSDQWTIIMGAAVALSLAIAAPFNRYSHRLFIRLEPWLLRWERRSKHPDRIPTTVGSAQWLVFGMGRTGRAAYDVLEKEGFRVVGLDADPARVEAQRLKGLRIFYGDAEDFNLWETLRTRHLRGILFTMPEFQTRLTAIGMLRQNGFSGLIGTTSFGARDDAALRAVGADVLFHPLTEAGEQLAARMLRSARDGFSAKEGGKMLGGG